MNPRSACGAVLGMALGAATAGAWPPGALAQSPATPRPIPTVAVQLVEGAHGFANGRAAVFHGTADADGVAFVIPGLTINTPAAIVLESSDPRARMSLRLKNDFSPGWDRQLSTGADGAIDTRFRTEGPAVALVSSDGGMHPYRLAIWAGPEIKPHTLAPPPFVSQAEYDRLQGGGRTRIAVAAGALLALVAGLAVWLRRRSRA